MVTIVTDGAVSGGSSGGSWSKLYEVDFTSIATQDLQSGGDGTKTIDGNSWSVFSATNCSAASIGANGLECTFNTASHSALGFGADVLASDLSSSFDIGLPTRIFLLFETNAARNAESMGVRMVEGRSTVGFASSTRQQITSFFGIYNTTQWRAPVGFGHDSAATGNAPSGYQNSTNTSALMLEVSGGAAKTVLFKGASGLLTELPTDPSTGTITSAQTYGGTTATTSPPLLSSDVAIQLHAWAGNTTGGFNPKFKAFSLWQFS